MFPASWHQEIIFLQKDSLFQKEHKEYKPELLAKSVEHHQQD